MTCWLPADRSSIRAIPSVDPPGTFREANRSYQHGSIVLRTQSWIRRDAQRFVMLTGHSSIQITFDKDGYLLPQSRREAAAKLQAAMIQGNDAGNGGGLVAVNNISAKKRLMKGVDGD